MSGPFTLWSYSKALPVVYLGNAVASLFIDGREPVTTYSEILADLSSIALDEHQSRDLLAKLASDYDRPREGRDDLVHEDPLLA